MSLIVHELDLTASCVSLRHTKSDLWRLRGLRETAPALLEAEWRVPSGDRQFSTCNDERKNYTDLQETAEWFSGCQFWQKLLESLLSHLAEDSFRLPVLIHIGYHMEAKVTNGPSSALSSCTPRCMTAFWKRRALRWASLCTA